MFYAMRSLNETNDLLQRQKRTVTTHNYALTKYRKLNNRMRENQYIEAQRERDKRLQERHEREDGAEGEHARSVSSVGEHLRMSSLTKISPENEEFLDGLVAEINQLAKIEKMRREASKITGGPRPNSELLHNSDLIHVKGLLQWCKSEINTFDYNTIRKIVRKSLPNYFK